MKNRKIKPIVFASLALCIVFLVAAFVLQVPDYTISHYGDNSAQEYVGGDAYNYIIEASLRGGRIAGILVSKTICFAMSAVFLMLSVKSFLSENPVVMTDKADLQKTEQAEDFEQTIPLNEPNNQKE